MYRSQIADFVEYTNGRGVNSVVDYYYASTSDIIGEAGLPEKGAEGWKTNITDTGFNAINKYLWNYEKITFSSGTPTTTNFAVISIYGKEIEEIAEFYRLSNSEDIPTDLPTMTDNNGWTRITTGISIPVPTQDNRYLWNYEITQYTDNSEYKSGPACVAVHGERGNDGVGTPGASLEVQYQYAETSNEIKEEDWQYSMPQIQADSILWMRQKMSNETNWGEAIQISAKDGNTPTVNIVDVEQPDGTIKKFWQINEEITEVSAEGQEGHSPVITIENGVWVIDGEATEQQAQGATGKDGASIEFVYYRSEGPVEDWSGKAPNNTEDDGWSNSPQGIDSTNKYEYMSVRTKAEGADSWSSFSSPPVIWSKWGDKGQDGDGVEYKYCLTDLTVDEKPIYPLPEGATYNWTDDPTGVSGEEGEKYEYVAIIKTTYDSDNTATITSSVTLWNQYVRDGLSSYSMELNNDSDVIAISASNGQPLGSLPTITAKTFLGTDEITDGQIIITATGCTLDNGSDDGATSLTGRQATLKSISEPSGKVIFSWRPNGAGEDPLLEKTFTFNKITSPVDYDLIIPQTNFNSKNTVAVEVNILRKREGQPADIIGPTEDASIEVQYQQKDDTSWETLSSSTLTITNKNKPYTFRIVKSDDESFVWDSETIEFVSDGNNAKDFNVTASSYVFTKNRAGTITNSPITLTAHAINLGENLTYVWSKYDSEQDKFSPISGYSSSTFGATSPGRYKVAIKDISWEDEIVLGETQDGATGPAAISITLSNPTMTFHKQTSSEIEECKIIVYEGGEPLSVGQQESGPYYTISIHNDSSSVQGVDIEGDTVEISDKNTPGSCKITVFVHPSEGDNSSKDFIINWKTIDDGNDAQDFNITASSYALVKGADGNYKNEITLTAHKINITEGTLQWKKPGEASYGHANEDTIEATIPGIYSAKITTAVSNDDEWEDQIVITEVVDGANGKDAIAVVLSNPSMTFNKTTGGTEQCEVIVYEGANKLNTSGTGAKFSVAKKTESQNSKASVDGASITIESPSENGSEEFTVSITTSQNESVSEDVTVYWTVVDNGSKGDTVTTTATEQVIYFLTEFNTRPATPGKDDIDYPNLKENSIDDGEDGGEVWTKLRSGVTSRLKYEYMSKRQITTTQIESGDPVSTPGNWSEPVLCDCYYQEVAVLNTFNALTQDDKKFGVFGASENKCIINAEYIQAGALTVKNSNKQVVFSAGFSGSDAGRVTMAKFTVENSKLYSGNKTTYNSSNTGVYIGESGIGVGRYNAGTEASPDYKPSFYVTSAGAFYAQVGEIGSFGFTSDRLVATSTNNDYFYLIANPSWGKVYTTSPIGQMAGLTSNIQECAIRAGKAAEATFAITPDGSFYAMKGNIGGWTISNQGMYYSPGNTTEGIGLWPTKTKKTGDNRYIAIHAGANNTNIGGAPFRLYHDGGIVATKGEIGGWEINSDKLSYENCTLFANNSETEYSTVSRDNVPIRIKAGIETTTLLTNPYTAYMDMGLDYSLINYYSDFFGPMLIIKEGGYRVENFFKSSLQVMTSYSVQYVDDDQEEIEPLTYEDNIDSSDNYKDSKLSFADIVQVYQSGLDLVYSVEEGNLNFTRSGNDGVNIIITVYIQETLPSFKLLDDGVVIAKQVITDSLKVTNGDYYTKKEIDKLVFGNNAPVFNNYYTKNEINNNFYNKDYIDTWYYKKESVYQKTETYNQTEVNNLLAGCLKSDNYQIGMTSLDWEDF